MKKFLFLLIVSPIFFIGCEDSCIDVVCDKGLAQQDSNGICFCECTAGFTGEKCDECVEGFEGDNCDQPIIDPCADVTCENNGTCVDGTCDCPDGFEGDNCETVNLCFDIPCNGENGSYSIVDGVCTCECNEGFTGDDCSLEIETNFIAIWNATDMCEFYMYTDTLGMLQPSFSYQGSIFQDMMGEYLVQNFGGYDPNLAFGATIENNTVVIPPSVAATVENGEIIVEDVVGTLSEDGNTINWTYSTNLNGDIDSCTSVWTKVQ